MNINGDEGQRERRTWKLKRKEREESVGVRNERGWLCFK